MMTAMFGMSSIRVWHRLYMRSSTESYKDLGDKSRGIFEVR